MRILLLEDDEQDYHLIKNAFSNFKSSKIYDLHWAETIDIANDLTSQNDYDLFLLDYSLKSGSGLDFVESLSKKSIQNIPFIFITGHDSAKLFEKSLNYKIFDYILKDDLNPSLLERAIIIAQDRKQKERALVKQKELDAQKAKMQSLGQLAGGMAHELNNLIHPALLQTEMIDKENLTKYSKQDIDKYFGLIERNLRTASSIIDTVMIFANADNTDHKSQSINISQNIHDAVKHYIEDSESALSFKIDTEEEIQAQMDPLIFQQILKELFENADTAMNNKGNIEIRASLRESHMAEIKIIDQGKGIDKEHLPHLFNPFFTTKRVGDGKGLGLSTVYKILEDWEGSISVDNNIKKGVTATVLLKTN